MGLFDAYQTTSAEKLAKEVVRGGLKGRKVRKRKHTDQVVGRGSPLIFVPRQLEVKRRQVQKPSVVPDREDFYLWLTSSDQLRCYLEQMSFPRHTFGVERILSQIEGWLEKESPSLKQRLTVLRVLTENLTLLTSKLGCRLFRQVLPSYSRCLDSLAKEQRFDLVKKECDSDENKQASKSISLD